MIIDLTREINESTPVTQIYKTLIEIAFFKKLPENPNFSKFKIYSHRGTHMDAPYHFIENGKKICELNIDKFIGKGQLINLCDKKREIIEQKDIENIKIEGNGIIFLCTGFEKYWKKQLLNQWTILSKEAAEYLVSFKPKLIGIDSPGIDTIATNYEAHKIILGADIPIIEGLVNLDKLINKKYEVFAFPLKISGLEASPARVIARKMPKNWIK